MYFQNTVKENKNIEKQEDEEQEKNREIKIEKKNLEELEKDIKDLQEKYFLLMEEIKLLKTNKPIKLNAQMEDEKEKEWLDNYYYQNIFTSDLVHEITGEIYVSKTIRMHGKLFDYLSIFCKKYGLKQQEVYSQGIFTYLLNYHGKEKRNDNLKEMEKYIRKYIKSIEKKTQNNS